jgi:Mce-associated membrane protein
VTDTPEAVDFTTVEEPSAEELAPAAQTRRAGSAQRVVAFVVLPVLALLLAVGAAYFKWQDSAAGREEAARTESVQAARDIAVAMLTYEPGTVETHLAAVRDRLTEPWKQTFSSMVDTVVVPGAKAQQITAVASVPAAASVTAAPEHAVVLLFVNQTVTVGSQQPKVTAASVRVTLDKVGGRWLIAKYEPV